MSLLPAFVLDDPYVASAFVTMNFIKCFFNKDSTSPNTSKTSFKTIQSDNSCLNEASAETNSTTDGSSGIYDTVAVSNCSEAAKHFNVPFYDEFYGPEFDTDDDYAEQGKHLLINNPVEGFTPGRLSDACWKRIEAIIAAAEKDSSVTNDNSFELAHGAFTSSNDVGGNVSKVAFFDYTEFQPKLNSTPSRIH